jgi:hypothetical protein
VNTTARRIASAKAGFIAVIAGLDPAIPIIWHGRAILSGMAGSSPAMTILRDFGMPYARTAAG